MNSRSRSASGQGAGLVVVFVLGILTAVGPFSLDAYLPGFPSIAEEFGASEQTVQFSLTACLLGLALGQIFAGPWSDRIGRRLPLLIGSTGYILASVVCALAPSIEIFIAMRFVQGFAGAAGLVLARAVVRDVSRDDKAVVLYSQLAVVSGIAPVIAPVIGAALLVPFGWRGVFWALAAIGTVISVLVAVFLAETHPLHARSSGNLGAVLRAFGHTFRDRQFASYALLGALGAAILFTYISSSSFVLQEVHGLDPAGFALVFGSNGLGLVIAGAVNARLARRFGPGTILLAGLLAQAGGIVVLAVATGLADALGDLGTPAVICGIFLSVVPFGFIAPNCTSLAMARSAGRAGTASAVLGVTMFLAGAIVSPLSGAGNPETTMVIVMGVASVLSIATAVGMRNRRTTS